MEHGKLWNIYMRLSKSGIAKGIKTQHLIKL
jgi:hypothetical protein